MKKQSEKSSDRKPVESKLAAVAITEGDITILITEGGKYTLSKGELLKAEKISSYFNAVREEFFRISQRLGRGQFGGKYVITYDGKLNFPVKSS